VIRIHRRANAPTVLLTEGAARRQQHEMDIDSDPAAYSSGGKKLEFDRTIYAHESVKRDLVEMQHEKCAFCEAKPLHVSDGDVEHFRPKAAVRQDDTAPLRRPGYYWLAYEWDNLLFACERCNRRHKRNFFPLTDPARRAQTHRDAVANEAPIFIDPSVEDPRQYISYREHIPIAVNGHARGEQTIVELGLRRAELNADRERHLSHLSTLHMAATLPGVPAELRERARASLAQLVAPEAEYALMCQVAIESLGGLPPPVSAA
jgi:uncharacterized protein (TIGR02646 family)